LCRVPMVWIFSKSETLATRRMLSNQPAQYHDRDQAHSWRDGGKTANCS
jgi:hypothetical protein